MIVHKRLTSILYDEIPQIQDRSSRSKWSLIYGFMARDMKQCHASLRWECQFQKLRSYLDTRMCGSCSDTLISIQKICSRNMRRSRIVQRYNDKCHRRWHKLPRGWWRVFVGSHAPALWLVVKKHDTVKIWQTQEPSANANEGQQKRLFLVTPRCHKQW